MGDNEEDEVDNDDDIDRDEENEGQKPHIISAEDEKNSTSITLTLVLICLVLLSVMNNCRQYDTIRKMRRSGQIELMPGVNESITKSSEPGNRLAGTKKSVASPLHGGSKEGITYTKVATEVDSDGGSEDETIEFNDLDMTVREFNPFSFGSGADKA